MKTLARRVAANLSAAGYTEPGIAILAGDSSKELKKAILDWKDALPQNWEVKWLNVALENNAAPNYKTEAQIVIAKLRSAAFSEARRYDPEFCWSLDSDTLPPANALRCMIDMLHFDRGYYSVSTCPYPNDLFLGGRGTPQNHISPTLIDAERVIPEDLKADIEKP